MPITKKDAPGTLPDRAKEIYVSAFNSAYEDTCKERSDRDACAGKIAWSAVKTKYKKKGDKWVRKAKTEGADGQLQGDAGLGTCVCPKCGGQAEHEQGFECERMNCPTCGEFMVEPALSQGRLGCLLP